MPWTLNVEEWLDMMPETLDPRRCAVVFFDTLKVYAYDKDLKAVLPEARAQVEALSHLASLARSLDIPICYARADHRPDGKDGAPNLTDIALAPQGERSPDDPFARRVWGTEAADVIDEIAPQPGDYQIPKHRWNMFFQTELELSLRARDIDTIILAGGSTEVGIASSVYAGRDLDFNTVLVREGLRSGRGRWVSDYFVDHIAPSLTRVRTLSQVAAMLGAPDPGLAPAGEDAEAKPPELLPAISPNLDPRLDSRRTALLCFDMLKGATYGQTPLPPHIEPARRMLAAARQLKMPVFYTRPIHRQDGADWCSALTDGGQRPPVEKFGRLRIDPGSFAGAPRTEVLPELEPTPEDYVIKKHRYSAFHGTNLELSLCTAGIENVLLAGGSMSAGVASTAYAVRDRDFNLVTLSDACSGSSPELMSYFLDHVLTRMGRVRTVDQAIALLQKA